MLANAVSIAEEKKQKPEPVRRRPRYADEFPPEEETSRMAMTIKMKRQAEGKTEC